MEFKDLNDKQQDFYFVLCYKYDIEWHRKHLEYLENRINYLKDKVKSCKKTKEKAIMFYNKKQFEYDKDISNILSEKEQQEIEELVKRTFNQF
jgi:hypothetical protein